MTLLGILMLAVISYLWGHSRGESQEAAYWERIVKNNWRTIDALRREIAEREDDGSGWRKRGEQCPY